MFKDLLKRIPPFLLAGGASLTLGLLSLGGMFALTPLWPLGLATFILAVAYEYEIYKQNITGAFNKLFFVKNYLKQRLANDFLRDHFHKRDPKASPEEEDNREQFFIDYELQLRALEELEHADLDQAGKKRKKHIEKTKRDMERWFTEQLFLAKTKRKAQDKLDPKDYADQIQLWLNQQINPETKQFCRDELQATLKNRSRLFYFVGGFSLLSAACMGLGTTYLLSETLALIPIVASISATMPPAVLLILATGAGIAYGVLTYNAVTDMINNETVQKIFKRLRDFVIHIKNKEVTWSEVKMALATTLLVSLAVALTVCTAGTWWTVGKETAPLFAWLSKIPGFIIERVTPIVSGIASLIFNVENTKETVDMIAESERGFFETIRDEFNKVIERIRELPKTENLGQRINPARILLKLTIAPLRTLLFIGHLLSIAVSGDRIPGLSEVVSTILGFFSEFGEDAHYFVPHTHKHKKNPTIDDLLKEHLSSEHGHSHDNDFPTKVLKFVFEPIYIIAALFDWIASRFNPKKAKTTTQPDKEELISPEVKERPRLSLREAYNKHVGHSHWHSFFRGHGHHHDHDHAHKSEESTSEPIKPKVSLEWEKQSILMHSEDFKQEHYSTAKIGKTLAAKKETKFTDFQTKIKTVNSLKELEEVIRTAEGDAEIKTHRHPSVFKRSQENKTAGQTFWAKIQQEVAECELIVRPTAESRA